MHPHWVTMLPISALLGLSIVGALVLIGLGGDGTPWTVAKVFAAVVVLVVLLAFARRYAEWSTTEFVVTTERVISRRGVVAKNGIEIPLDRINTVFFEQTAAERLLGSGNLGIESAGEGGRQTFTNIRKPNLVQAEIYSQKEKYEDRRLQRMGEASAGGGQAAAAPIESIPDQIAQLDELRSRGVLTNKEFQKKKEELLRRM